MTFTRHLRRIGRRIRWLPRLRERFPGLYSRAAQIGLDLILNNAGRRSRRVHAPQSGRLALPRSAMLEPTLRCNLDCRMCFQRSSRDSEPGPEWTLAQMRQAFDRIELDLVRLIGGEPLVREDIHEWLAYFDRRGVALSLCSNGTLLDDSALRQLESLDHLVLAVISVNGRDEVFRRITGSDRYSTVAEAIARCAKTLPVGISTVCLDDNLDELAALVPALRGSGALFVYITFEQIFEEQDLAETRRILQTHLGWGADCVLDAHVADTTGLAPDAIRAGTGSAIERGQRHELPVFTLPPVWSRHLESYCRGSAREDLRLGCRYLIDPVLNVDPQGNVLHCEFIRHGFGNLGEQPLERIWNGDEFVAFRELLLRENLLPICKRCCKAVEVG